MGLCCMCIFLVDNFQQPCKRILSLTLQKRRLRHRKDVCRVYTHLMGGKEVGKELTLRVRRPHTVEGLQYQELIQLLQIITTLNSGLALASKL